MSRLSKNIFYNLAGQGLLLILGFVAVRYVFTRLGADALGIIYFTITLSTVLVAVLEMGICSTTTREVAAHFNDDPSYIRDLIRTASLFYWGAYLLLGVGIYWGAPYLVERWINLKSMDASTATRMVQILGLGTLSVLPRSFYGSLLSGLQRMEFNNLINVSTSVLQQFGTIVILVLGGDLSDVVYWLTSSFGLSLLAYLLVSLSFFPFRSLMPGYSPTVVRRNFNYTSNMAAISVLAMVHAQADKVVVSKLLPIATFGFYAFASSVVSKLTLATGAISQAAFPSFSAVYNQHDNDSLLAQYHKLQDLLCFATLPVLSSIPFVAVPLFTYLLNPQAARILLLPVTLLCVGTYMNGTLHIPYVFSLAAGKPEITARLNFYALFVVIPVAVISVYYFGLAGAGVSWVFYHLFAYAYAIRRICSECLGISTAGWYRHVLKMAGLASVTYGAAWMIRAAMGTESILSLALAYAFASIAFLVGAYWMIGDELRKTFLRFLRIDRIKIAEVL